MPPSSVAPQTAVLLEPRPGSLLEGSLWHPDPSTLTGCEARRLLEDVVAMRSFLAVIEALAVERVRLACEDEARRAEEAAEKGRAGRGQAAARRFGGDAGRALAVSEVAVAEGIGEQAAARLLTAAQALCGPQLVVLDRLEAGDLTEAHARVITEETATLPTASAERFGILCLSRLETRTGRRRTPAEFRKAVRSLRERLHPDSVRARRARAERDRGVWLKPEPDGMCTLGAFLPAEVGLAAFNRIDALARARQDEDPEEGRTLAQLRADELAGCVLTAGAGGEGRSIGRPANPRHASAAEAVRGEGVPRPSAEIVVHVRAESLLGASDEPAVLEGYGPIDAETARALAVAAPTWERLLETSDGVPLTLARSAYRPPKGLRRFICYRDGTCQFPGCPSPALRAEIDHIREWQDGGPTDASNLQALCRKHHALKSLRLWRPTRLEGDGVTTGDLVWTSPLGARALAGPGGHEFGVDTNLEPEVPDPPAAPDPPEVPDPSEMPDPPAAPDPPPF
jgi:hypothetical protein